MVGLVKSKNTGFGPKSAKTPGTVKKYLTIMVRWSLLRLKSALVVEDLSHWINF